MKTVEVSYPAGTISADAIFIERPDHAKLFAISDEHADSYIKKIGHEAYEGSVWLQELAQEHSIQPHDLASRAFNLANPTKVDSQVKKDVASERKPGNRTTYWLGERVKHLPEDSIPVGGSAMSYLDYVRTGSADGFVKIMQEGYRAGLGWRALQNTTRLGVYACIHDLAVKPHKQGQNLGLALAYTGLREQPQHIKTSLYTPANNEPVIIQAEKHGYRVTNEYQDNDFLPGISVPMLRFEASSVRSVVSSLEDTHPGLKGSKRLQ